MVLAQKRLVLAQNIPLLAQNLIFGTIKQRTLICTFGSKLHSFSSKHIAFGLKVYGFSSKHIIFGPNIGSNFDADTSLKV